MKSFWNSLQKPIFVLAPMADVTDCAFREIIAQYGKPDVFFTEFVSTDGLCSIGREHLMVDLAYTERQRPIVAQIWGSNPQHFYETAQLLLKLGFDGIDINMGCPDKNVCKQGGGAYLIKNPKLAKDIIRATQKGAPKLPVSIKIRLGYQSDMIEEWITHVLEAEPQVITIHGRTKKEMSDVPTHWDRIKEGVRITRKMRSKTLIFGNGDVQNLDDALSKVRDYEVDGVMLGRAIFGNPWLFNREKNISKISLRERFSVMIEHTRLFKELFVCDEIGSCGDGHGGTDRRIGSDGNFNNKDGSRVDKISNHSTNTAGKKGNDLTSSLNFFSPHLLRFPPFVDALKKGFFHKNFSIMKKHYKAYVSGFSGAKELRMKLMEAQSAQQVEGIISSFS